MLIRVVIAGVVLVGAAPAGVLGQGLDLSGRWAYDATQSDNPRDQMRGGDSTGRASGEGGALPAGSVAGEAAAPGVDVGDSEVEVAGVAA